MTTRELGAVREALNAAGIDISYAYEDLVFPEHNGFLLQFGAKEHEVLIHINAEANETELSVAINLLEEKGGETGLVFHQGDYYHLNQADENNIHLEFHKNINHCKETK